MNRTLIAVLAAVLAACGSETTTATGLWAERGATGRSEVLPGVWLELRDLEIWLDGAYHGSAREGELVQVITDGPRQGVLLVDDEVRQPVER